MSFQVHPARRLLRHLRGSRARSPLCVPSLEDGTGLNQPVASVTRGLASGPHQYSTFRGSRMSHVSLGSGAQPSDGQRLAGPLPLVGRTRELSVLEALIEAPDPAASLVLVSGEGGVGKSRLVAEFAGRAQTRGWDVVHGRAYPVERGVPYALFADAFLPLLSAMDPDRLTVLSRGGEAELSYLFPALAADREEGADAAGGDPEEFRTRLLWNFAEFLNNFADDVPRWPVTTRSDSITPGTTACCVT